MTYKDLIEKYRTQQAAADALGVAQTTVAYWKKRGIPRDAQIDIEARLQGALRADLPQQVRAQ
jgi:predicted transcriptional regulator